MFQNATQLGNLVSVADLSYIMNDQADSAFIRTSSRGQTISGLTQASNPSMATSPLVPRRISTPRTAQSSSAQLDALKTSERRWAYALLRLLLGVNFFGHGFIRIYHGVPNFAVGITAQMSSALLPSPFVHAFAMTIPWIELTLGTLLILGLFLRATLTVAMLFMTALMVGVTIHQDWPTAGIQLVYGFVIFSLLFLREPYAISWSRLLGITSESGHDPVQ